MTEQNTLQQYVPITYSFISGGNSIGNSHRNPNPDCAGYYHNSTTDLCSRGVTSESYHGREPIVFLTHIALGAPTHHAWCTPDTTPVEPIHCVGGVGRHSGSLLWEAHHVCPQTLDPMYYALTLMLYACEEGKVRSRRQGGSTTLQHAWHPKWRPNERHLLMINKVTKWDKWPQCAMPCYRC